jgi:hypothetical protein
MECARLLEKLLKYNDSLGEESSMDAMQRIKDTAAHRKKTRTKNTGRSQISELVASNKWPAHRSTDFREKLVKGMTQFVADRLDRVKKQTQACCPPIDRDIIFHTCISTTNAPYILNFNPP